MLALGSLCQGPPKETDRWTVSSVFGPFGLVLLILTADNHLLEQLFVNFLCVGRRVSVKFLANVDRVVLPLHAATYPTCFHGALLRAGRQMSSVEQELWNIFTFYTLHGNPLDPEHLRVSC